MAVTINRQSFEPAYKLSPIFGAFLCIRENLMSKFIDASILVD